MGVDRTSLALPPVRRPWGGWLTGTGMVGDFLGQVCPPAHAGPSCRGASRPPMATCPAPGPAPAATTWQPWPPRPSWVGVGGPLLPLASARPTPDTSCVGWGGHKAESQLEGLWPHRPRELGAPGSSGRGFPPPQVRSPGPPSGGVPPPLGGRKSAWQASLVGFPEAGPRRVSWRISSRAACRSEGSGTGQGWSLASLGGRRRLPKPEPQVLRTGVAL